MEGERVNCKYCNSKLEILNKIDNRHIETYCKKCGIGFINKISRRKRENFNNQRSIKTVGPQGFKTNCSSSNYNKEPIYKGGLCTPK
jgi:transcription initiation factor TFIIIB Brf1 subunit/transcription initiation factor TFIIB